MEETIVDVYKRFVRERATHSGIYLYNGYDSDLYQILKFCEPYIEEVEDFNNWMKARQERKYGKIRRGV